MQKRRIVAAVLSAAMMLTAAPFTAFAANADSAVDGVAVNKTASALQSRESTVTLTVGAPDGSGSGSSDVVKPGAPMAIEFVVDATTIVSTQDKNGKSFLDTISSCLDALADKNVYAGMTIFTSTGLNFRDYTELTADNVAALKKELASADTTIEILKKTLASPAGTNIEAGIAIASEKLKAFDKADDSSKYLVLITDGGAYWWNKSASDPTPVSQQYITEAGKTVQTGNTDVVEGGASLPAEFSYNSSLSRNASIAASTDVWLRDSYVSNIEKGTNFAYQTAANAISGDAFKMISVDFPYNAGTAALSAYAKSFVDKLPGDAIFVENKDFDFTDIFEDILDSAAVVPAGSTITDVIGQGTDSKGQAYSFDIKSGSNVTLTIGGKSETKAFANSISFFDGKYVFTYHSGSDEYFTLDIKEPILPSAPLKLSYTVYLADRGSKDGTHSELYTNVQATLEAPGINPIPFPRPEVSYRIDGGSSSGGTIDIEEPEVPQGLNGDDHFQYVMGYTDGTVRPLAKITRAEVAAIFYRLLDDETRERYFTTENDFPDMKDTMWYNKAVSTLSNAGIITGCSDGLFHGSRNITRAELATIIAKFDDHVYEGRDYFNDISTHWARTFINSSADNGWIVGDGSGKFRPYDDITRAEVMTMINAVLNRAVDEDGLCDGYKKWPDNPKTAWYYYQVIEATNYHDYEREADMTEDWIEILPDKVWNEAGVD